MIIYTTDIKACGTDTFLQYKDRATGKWYCEPIDNILRIEYERPLFTITLKK